MKQPTKKLELRRTTIHMLDAGAAATVDVAGGTSVPGPSFPGPLVSLLCAYTLAQCEDPTHQEK